MSTSDKGGKKIGIGIIIGIIIGLGIGIGIVNISSEDVGTDSNIQPLDSHIDEVILIPIWT